ncbi:hypothetical protein ACFCXT_30435 [Streptomyces vinaceus]|uniref:hypothetical protein n=1 Tax=Streptomyces vinaceus TaxID=1960 RepID=UPI0035E12957
MRKALTISAFALTAAVAVGAPATAFAADTPQAPAANPTSNPLPPAKDLGVTLTPATAKAGDVVKLKITGPKLTNVKISSDALTKTSVFQNAYGQGTVKSDVQPGTYAVTVSGTTDDGKTATASADLTVTGQAPAATGVLTLSPGEGVQGAKVDVSLKIGGGSQPKTVTVKSSAFEGGSVTLEQKETGVWKGTVTVAGNAKQGDHSVVAESGIPGTRALATGTFKVTSKTPVTPDKPSTPSESPVPTAEHVVPKGSVNTGMAPAASVSGSSSMAADITAGGVLAAGAAAALAMTLRNRHHNGA